MRYLACSIRHHDGTFTVQVGGPLPQTVTRVGYHGNWIDQATKASLGRHSLKAMRRKVSYESYENNKKISLDNFPVVY